MSSVLRSVRKRKKVRRLGEVNVINREAYAGFDLDGKVEAIRALVPLGLIHVKEMLDQEVVALAGERYVRKAEATNGRRHGEQPGHRAARWSAGADSDSAHTEPLGQRDSIAVVRGVEW